MKTIYNLLHFHHKTPKRLHIAIPDTVPDVDKQEGVIISIVCEDNSQSFALSTAEIGEFIVALLYASEMLQWRRIAGINAKYNIINKK